MVALDDEQIDVDIDEEEVRGPEVELKKKITKGWFQIFEFRPFVRLVMV